MTEHPIGTKLFFVPIRFWEDHPIETGRVALHTTFEGKVLPSFTHDGFVYAFHDGYGHDVYMKADRTFITEAEAQVEKDRLAAEKTIADNAAFEAWWQKFMKETKNDHGPDIDRLGLHTGGMVQKRTAWGKSDARTGLQHGPNQGSGGDEQAEASPRDPDADK